MLQTSLGLLRSEEQYTKIGGGRARVSRQASLKDPGGGSGRDLHRGVGGPGGQKIEVQFFLPRKRKQKIWTSPGGGPALKTHECLRFARPNLDPLSPESEQKIRPGLPKFCQEIRIRTFYPLPRKENTNTIRICALGIRFWSISQVISSMACQSFKLREFRRKNLLWWHNSSHNLLVPL